MKFPYCAVLSLGFESESLQEPNGRLIILVYSGFFIYGIVCAVQFQVRKISSTSYVELLRQDLNQSTFDMLKSFYFLAHLSRPSRRILHC